MPAEDVVDRYLASLESGSLDEILAQFTQDAVVHSPLYGRNPAREYFPELLKTTKASDTEVRNVAVARGGGLVFLHFVYDWTLADDKFVQFECVDVLTLSEERDKIAEMRIIYDTAPLRADFEKVLAEVG